MNHRISRAPKVRHPLLAGALFFLLALPTCSLFNREGPTATCAELAGRGNACKDGIIASCTDGVTLSAVVCDDANACEASWQKPGVYRCSQSEAVPCGKVECGGACVDTASDVLNCGRCGVGCPSGGVCAAGACECPATLPAACAGACVDTKKDVQNCGACGKSCEAGEICNAGTCGLCVPGAKQCSGSTPETCDASGHWQSGATCPYLCTGAGVCSGSCVPTTKECSGTTPQTCDASGQWQSGAACPYLCTGTGNCTGACVPSTKQCSVNTPQTCDASGQWQSGAACPYVCTGAGNCAGVCVPAAKQCAGPIAQICSASGAWQDAGAVAVSAGRGSSIYAPSAVIDTANGKLLVVTEDWATSVKPALVRCNLDGTACAYVDISAGQGANSGNNPSAVIDGANGKLLVVTEQGVSPSVKAALFRCNLDGTACSYADLSAGQGYQSGQSPSPVIDAANGKLLVATEHVANSSKPALFRCNLDGTACTYLDISAGRGAGTGRNPSAVIDTANGKLLVVTGDGNVYGKPALFRCNLDGTGCTYTDISAGQGADSGAHPSALIDAASGKLLVVTQNNSNSGKPALFRCNLDGSACSYADLSAGQGTDSGSYPSAVVDAAHGKLLVVTQNNSNSGKPALFRCNLDGSACSYADVSGGAAANSGLTPSAVIDAGNARLLAVARNSANSTAALYSMCLQ